jgi:hypothetical protein
MVRVFLTVVLPLLLPTALYLAWVFAVRAVARDRGSARWRAVPWVWLAAAGVGLLALMLVLVTVGFGSRQEGVYIAPRYVNGHIIPGHIEPPARR